MQKTVLRRLIREEIKKVIKEISQSDGAPGVAGYDAFINNREDLERWRQWKLSKLIRTMKYELPDDNDKKTNF